MMRQGVYLMRLFLPTDANPATGYDQDADPEYEGMFSTTMNLGEGDRIVGTDWSEKGYVVVTIQKNGPSPVNLR